MYVNNESEEINNISIKLLLFCIKKNIYIELKNRNTFNEYILNNTIHGFYIKKNKINIFMFQNKKETKFDFVCDECKISHDNIYLHFFNFDNKIEIFCKHSNFLENKISKLIIKNKL